MIPGSRRPYTKRAKQITTVSAGVGRMNVAASVNGGIATGSTLYTSGGVAIHPANAAINGDRKGLNWGTSGGWGDGTSGSYPDILEIDFGTSQTIDTVDVITIQDNFSSPSEPTPQMTFSLYGITAYSVDYWTGSAWVQIPGTSVTGNNLVWRRFTFTPISTTKIRLVVTAALASYTRVIEVEAWTFSTTNAAPPTIDLSSPEADALFTAGDTVTITADINPVTTTGGELSRIELLRDGVVIDSVDPASAGTYTYDDTPDAGNPEYTIIAYDDTHSTSREVSVSVTVSSAVSLGFFEDRAAMVGVQYSNALDTDDNDNVLTGTWPWDAVGIWEPLHNPDGSLYRTHVENRLLPLPSIDPTEAPLGRSGSGLIQIINNSPANAGGGFFFSSRGGNVLPNNTTNPGWENNIPNYDDIDLRIHGSALVGIETAFQFLVKGDSNYCSTDYFKHDSQTNTMTDGLIGHKIFDITRPNYGVGGSAVWHPTTDDDTKLVCSGQDFLGQLWPGFYAYLTIAPGTNSPVTVARGASGDFDMQPRMPNTHNPYASYDLCELLPGKNNGATYGHPSGEYRGGIKTTWSQCQIIVKLLAILAGPITAGDGGDTSPKFRCSVNIKLYWGDFGQPEELVVDQDWSLWVGPHWFHKINLFPYLTSKSVLQTHPDAKVWYSSLIIRDRKIPSAAEVEYNWNPAWRDGASLNTWHALPNSNMSAYTAAGGAPGNGNPDFNSTTWEPWNTAGNGPQIPWGSGGYDAWGGLQIDDLRGYAYHSIKAGHYGSGAGLVYQSNCVHRYKFTSETPSWEQVKQSSPYGPLHEILLDGDVRYEDGGPPGGHVFGSGNVIETATGPKLVFMRVRAPNDSGNQQSNVSCYAIFDINTQEWDTTSRSALEIDAYAAEELYPGTQEVYIFDGSLGLPLFRHHDFSTGVTTQINDPDNILAWGGQSDMFFDVGRDRAIVLQNSALGGHVVVGDHFRQINGTRKWKHQPLGSGSSGWVGTKLNAGFHDTWNDRYIVIDSLGTDVAPRMWAIDPISWNMTNLGNLPTVNKTDHVGKRVQLVRGLRALVWWGGFNQSGYFYPLAP